MMATTHGLWGLALGATLAVQVPESAPVALVAGFLGGVAPDLDIYANHRRSLHAPVYGTCLACLAVGVTLLAPSPFTVAVAAALAAAALHALMDAAGGGLSLRPWTENPDRAVYSHYHGQWVPPRQWVRYDGAPEDLLVAAAVGLPLLVVLDGYFQFGVAALLGCSVVYVAVRRRLVPLVEACLVYVPDSLSVVVPRRFDHLEE